jgi:hypothetical protein
VAQLIDLAAGAAEAQQAATLLASLQVQLSALYSSVMASAEPATPATPDQQLAALCLWINEVRRRGVGRSCKARQPECACW